MTFQEILLMLATGDEFTSYDTIEVSDLEDTYYIIRQPSDFLAAVQSQEKKSYIVIPEISLENEDISFRVCCGGWIFSKGLSIVNSSFERDVDFSNCVFLGNLLLDMVHFGSLLNFDYSLVTKAELTHIEFNRSCTSFNRFSVMNHINITHCDFKSGFSLQYREWFCKLNRPQTRPVFNFSYSRFHSAFDLDFTYEEQSNPIIILYKTEMIGNIDINYNALKKNGYRSLIFDHKIYLESISDSTADRLRYIDDMDNQMLRHKALEAIKANFETLALYYQTRATDRMLDLRYLYMKYDNKLNLYGYESGSTWQTIKRRAHWLASFVLLDVPFKYFTSWKATVKTIFMSLFFFFSVFMIFANRICDSNGTPLSYQSFSINFNDALDYDRIVNVLYFTLVTFTTIGYGDYHPTEFLRIVAGLEGLVGILLTSIFTVTLAKRILG